MKCNPKKRERGQSLVETALFLPIFLIILAGVVEVSQLIITKNRLTEAARATTRYGINGGDDVNMTLTAINTVSGTMDIDPERWDIWIIRGTVNANGTAVLDDSWQFEHTYGAEHTLSYTDTVLSDVKQSILDDLQLDADGDESAIAAANFRFIGTYLQHDAEPILGLGTLSELITSGSIHDMSIMRFVGSSQVVTSGCEAFPIAINGGTRSVGPPGDNYQAFPQIDEFYDSSAKPAYEDFIYHSTGKLLTNATSGTIFRVYSSGHADHAFSWLKWNSLLSDDPINVNESLRWPGNSTDYDPPCSGTCVGGDVWGYINPENTEDKALHVGDKVNNATVNNTALIAVVNKHINLGRTLRVIIRDETAGGMSTIGKFAIIKIHAHNLDAAKPWLLIEFVKYDSSCGQLTE